MEKSRGCLNGCGGTPSQGRKLKRFRIRIACSRWSPETEEGGNGVMRGGG